MRKNCQHKKFDWESTLSKHDLIWEVIPRQWNEGAWDELDFHSLDHGKVKPNPYGLKKGVE